jgi:hypothetical protein
MRSLSSLLLIAVAACTSAHADDASAVADEQQLGARAKPPALPTAGGTGALTPWGGTDAAHWRPEATLANATSEALNHAWSLPNVKDVVVAVPTKMYASNLAPYGDGQRNSIPTFGGWKITERPPVIATLIDFTNAPRRVLLRFDRALNITANAIEIVYYVNGTKRLADVAATKTPPGDLEAEWSVPDEVGFGLLSDAAVAIHPKGWNDWFPLWFRMPVKTVAQMHASATKFADGKSIIDREGVSVQGEQSPTQTPYERLASRNFSAKYNNQSGRVVPYNPTDIHGRFPFGGGLVTTGVGQGWTWVADERTGGFKVMYTCFEGRRPDLEASAPQGGVASGGGWHLIGDPAETIVNDLEAGPLVVAAATTTPFSANGLPGGGFAYGITDVATVRWLYPGEAFVVPRGDSAHDNFHWYFFHGAKNVCTEELVNEGAVPTNFEP